MSASANLTNAIGNPTELADQDLAWIGLGADPRPPLMGVNPSPSSLGQADGKGYARFLFLFLRYLCFILVLVMFGCCFRDFRQHDKWVGRVP